MSKYVTSGLCKFVMFLKFKHSEKWNSESKRILLPAMAETLKCVCDIKQWARWTELGHNIVLMTAAKPH
jgi:hypothetical protein